MDRLAALVQRHYETFLPVALKAIPAGQRAAFFEAQGAEMAERIADLEDSLAGEPVAGESFQQTAGRLVEARAAAEASVIREMLPDPEQAGIEAMQTPAQEELGSAEPTPPDPTTDALDAAVAAFWGARGEMDDLATAPTP